jgi:hypothetical protein
MAGLFVLSSLFFFFMPELGQMNTYTLGRVLRPQENAIIMGVGSINIFLIFISIFLSLSVLARQFQRDNLLFMLSKPLQAYQLLLGTQVALILALLAFWAVLSLELLFIIALNASSYVPIALEALLPVATLTVIYSSLAVFFFTLWPSFFSAIFPFMVIITSFARLDIKLLVSRTRLEWLVRLIDSGFILIPPIGQILGLPLKTLGIVDVPLNIVLLLGHSLALVVLLGLLSLKNISRIVDRI